MKKAIVSLLLLFSFAASAWPQEGAEALINDGAAYLGTFFKDRFDVRVAVVRFENESELTDLAMQKIYQMLISKLESEKNIRVSDLLVDFANGRGEFNLSQAERAGLPAGPEAHPEQEPDRPGHHRVFAPAGPGRGREVFRKDPQPRGRWTGCNTRDFAFAELGFSKRLEFESKADLMDIQSIADADGRQQIFLLLSRRDHHLRGQ